MLVVFATIAASRAFQAPRRVAQLLVRAEALKGVIANVEAMEKQAARLLWRTTGRAIGFVAFVEIVRWVPPANSPMWVGQVLLSVVVVCAIVVDVLSEWHARKTHPDLISVWPEHRVYAAHAARTILEQGKIFVLLGAFTSERACSSSVRSCPST